MAWTTGKINLPRLHSPRWRLKNSFATLQQLKDPIMKIFIKALCFLFLALCFSSCATLFTSKVSSISIESDPPSAEVKDKEGKILGTTPYSFTPSKEEKYSFYLNKKGFEESELSIHPIVDEAALFGDAM